MLGVKKLATGRLVKKIMECLAVTQSFPIVVKSLSTSKCNIGMCRGTLVILHHSQTQTLKCRNLYLLFLSLIMDIVSSQSLTHIVKT